MLEDFINAFKNFKSNKTRTFLSLLGVIIGVASVIVITSMGSSSTKQIQDTFGSAGLDVVSVSTGFMSRRGSSSSVVFDESARTDLFDNLKNIKKIWYKYNDPQFLEGRQPKKLAAASYSVFCSLSVSLVSLLRIPLAENHCRHNSKRVF